ncbi:MAG: 1,4-alpha-glucan branching protein domain-containing protein, partial [Pyrinomonadaceae bacterium]
WGANGFYKVWLNEKNSWMYPYQHDAERRMTRLASSEFGVPSSELGGAKSELGNPNLELKARVLNQLARELLLAESSDWAFQIYQGTTVDYSTRRFESHIHRFDLIADMIETGNVNIDLLAEIEDRDNIFPEIDFKVYRGD